MSHPFGTGNRLYRLDSIFNERAGPRMVGSQGERWYRHPVVPISSADAPHYAQASNLYPMRTSSERDNVYWYKPGTLSHGSQASTPAGTGQAVVIPVVHLGGSRGTSSPSSITESSPSTPQPDGGENPSRSSTFRTSSVVTTGNRPVIRSAPPPNDPEAEVDELTNLLMQSMETRSSAVTTATSGSLDGNTSSPAGSLRRGSGSNITIGLNSQLGRLQQHVGIGTNGGRGSPLTSAAGSSSTNSPTESSGAHISGENTSSPGAAGNSSLVQNTCFRCRRALVPPEGSTLSGTLATANNPTNVVTLTGALAVRLHVACFTCYRCAAPLRSDAYYHNLRRLLCPACVRDGAVETCSNCHRPIGDRVVRALGMPYHPNCFVCAVCAVRLDSKPFTIDVHGRLHCLADFHRRYAPRCASCGRPIAPESGCQEARRIVAGNSNYHLECFGIPSVNQTPSLKSTYKLTGSVPG